MERDFSINKNMLIENLHEETLVAQRLVCDSLPTNDEDYSAMSVIKKYVKAARLRYFHYLEDQKKNRKETERQRQRKAVEDEIKETKKKKKRLLGTTEMMKKPEVIFFVLNLFVWLNLMYLLCTVR